MNRLNCRKSFSPRRSSWLDTWVSSRKSGRPKKPRAILDYRCRVLLSEDEYEGPTIRRGGEAAQIEARIKNSRVCRYEEKKKKTKKIIEKGSVEDILYCDHGLMPNKFGGLSSKFGEIFTCDCRSSERRVKNVPKDKLILPASELERLKSLNMKAKRINLGDGGVTQAMVNFIHDRWKSLEIVKVKVSGTFAANMKRTHEILEMKTGGLVVWRLGTSVILFRGSNFGVTPSKQNEKQADNLSGIFSTTTALSLSSNFRDNICMISRKSLNNTEECNEVSLDSINENNGEWSSGVICENDIDMLLDSLGPRYRDWPGDGPLPVDADLLPKIIPNYQPPFRLFPYGVKHTIGFEMASRLQRVAKSLTPHFAVGRGRMHQGLATAMVKLWEVCSIAKITLKSMVMPTTGKQIAKDIKLLTGGVLLFRNKQYLIFYRGNNFLSRNVSEALLERERLAKTLLDEEEKSRLKALTHAYINSHGRGSCRNARIEGETLDANAAWVKCSYNDHDKNIIEEVEEHNLAQKLRYLKGRLSSAEWKLSKAKRFLCQYDGFLKSFQQRKSTKVITNEERSILHMLGLKMKPVLFTGARGNFWDTVKKFHCHWKYRDVVKVFAHAHNIDYANCIASSLVAESGGILVSVERRLTKYVIILYRGMDYRRPYVIRPKNLLIKRKALERPTKLRKCRVLESHVIYLEKSIEKLRLEINQLGNDTDEQDELYCGDDDDTDEKEEEVCDAEDEELLEDFYSSKTSIYSGSQI